MSLNHDIMLLADKTDNPKPYFSYDQFFGGSGYEVIDRVQLHDDLFAYMADSFRWMPTAFPRGDYKIDFNGLDREGITEILDAQKFQLIIQAWISLFIQAASQFSLRGEYVFPRGYTSGGQYEELFINQDELLAVLYDLSSICEKKLQDSQGRCRLISWGL